MIDKICILYLIILLNSPAKCEQTTENPVKVNPEYPVKPVMCTLNLGDKGTGGLTGLRGPKGEIGRQGDKGMDGSKGESGSTGDKGTNGLTGLQGPKGEAGSQGDKGMGGSKGESGSTGLPGTPGTCACPLPVQIEGDQGDGGSEIEWGDIMSPAQKTCRYAPEDYHKKGKTRVEKYLKISYGENDFKVYCNFKTNDTCIAFDNTGDVISYTEDKPFWLSVKNKTMNADTIYNVYSEQFLWLHRRSFSAHTKIRYHCKNSIPYRGHGTASNALMLLTWNGEKIGPEPTELTSFTYTVTYDGCLIAAKNEWNFTDIEIISGFNQRLPIVDFYIQDVGSDDQAFRIEIIDLCFS